MFQIERDANKIAQLTRRGRGNFLICTSDVASALAMAGVLDYAPALNSRQMLMRLLLLLLASLMVVTKSM